MKIKRLILYSRLSVNHFSSRQHDEWSGAFLWMNADIKIPINNVYNQIYYCWINTFYGISSIDKMFKVHYKMLWFKIKFKLRTFIQAGEFIING